MDNTQSVDSIRQILEIFKNTSGEIRPHFFLTGPSGSSKTHNIETLAKEKDLPLISVNAANLTKEGLSGNSLSKALTGIFNVQNQPAIVFVDEFDKLFISGNANCDLAHESTNGVQNEFLKILDGGNATVFGDYGKYHEVPAENLLFIFAGAFNGEDNITTDRLAELGVKTEFLGRVSLVYNLKKASLDVMYAILKDMKLLENYLRVFPDSPREDALSAIMEKVKEEYASNTVGVRLLIRLVHQYFIEGGFDKAPAEVVPFNPMAWGNQNGD